MERSQSWYLDLGMIGEYLGAARKYHHTPPISMLYALHAGLGVLLEEGLQASWARHQSCGRALQEGLEKLGFRLFAEEGHRLPDLTAVWLPEGVDDASARRDLVDRYGVEVSSGVGAFAGRVWRVGCMGNTARPRNVTLLLGALEELLSR